MPLPPDPPPLQSIESADALYTRVLARGRRLRRERRAFLLTAGMSLLLLAAAVPVALTNDDPAQLATTDQPTTTRRATTTTEFQYDFEPNPNAVTTTAPDTAPPVVAGNTVTSTRSARGTTRTTAPRRRASPSPTTARPATTRPPSPASTSTSTTVIPSSAPASACSGTPSLLGEHPLVFVRGGNVWLVGPTGPTQITSTDDASKPAWAPDGSRIVFARPGGLYTTPPTASGASFLAGTGTGDTDPAWSPDGSRIAFVRGGNIFTLPAGGAAHANLVMHQDAPLSKPTWSPNSCDLAFTWKSKVLKARSHDGTGVSKVHDSASQPSWGSGNRIAVAVEGDIRLVNPDGSNSTALGTGGGTQPSWNADSSAVAFKLDGGIATRTVNAPATTPVAGTTAGDTDPAW
jgi:Tol biopolymer transport system component